MFVENIMEICSIVVAYMKPQTDRQTNRPHLIFIIVSISYSHRPMVNSTWRRKELGKAAFHFATVIKHVIIERH